MGEVIKLGGSNGGQDNDVFEILNDCAQHARAGKVSCAFLVFMDAETDTVKFSRAGNIASVDDMLRLCGALDHQKGFVSDLVKQNAED